MEPLHLLLIGAAVIGIVLLVRRNASRARPEPRTYPYAVQVDLTGPDTYEITCTCQDNVRAAVGIDHAWKAAMDRAFGHCDLHGGKNVNAQIFYWDGEHHSVVVG